MHALFSSMAMIDYDDEDICMDGIGWDWMG